MKKQVNFQNMTHLEKMNTIDNIMNDFNNCFNITSLVLESRNSKEVELIILFYNSKKTNFIFVDSKNNKISSKELFNLYSFEKRVSKDPQQEIINALIKFHRNNTIDNLLEDKKDKHE